MTKQLRVMIGVKPETKIRVSKIKGDGYSFDRFINDLLDLLEEKSRSPPPSKETGQTTYRHTEEVIH